MMLYKRLKLLYQVYTCSIDEAIKITKTLPRYPHAVNPTKGTSLEVQECSFYSLSTLVERLSEITEHSNIYME
jgi:hypothetical protein